MEVLAHPAMELFVLLVLDEQAPRLAIIDHGVWQQ